MSIYRIILEPCGNQKEIEAFGRDGGTLETWLKSISSERKINYEPNGRLYVVILHEKRDLSKARRGIKKLSNLYRALFPPADYSSMPEVVIGRDFNATNEFLEGARGRHVPVGALPSELAKSRPLRITESGDIVEINRKYR